MLEENTAIGLNIQIKILKWNFNSEKEFYFNILDHFFNLTEDEDYEINRWEINSILSTIEVDINYLLENISVFKEYYESKPEC